MKNNLEQDNLLNKFLFEINYKINSDNYTNFSKILFKDFLNKQTKKAYITSFFLIIIAVFFAIYIFVAKQYKNCFLDFLISLIFIMSFYSVLFYKKIFPKVLEKNSKKAYKSTRFYNQDINLKFFENYLIETINNKQVKINFFDITKKQEDDNLIILTTSNNYIIINKNVISKELKDFLYYKLAGENQFENKNKI